MAAFFSPVFLSRLGGDCGKNRAVDFRALSHGDETAGDGIEDAFREL